MEYSFSKRYDFSELVNEAERLVIEELERQIVERSDQSICLCEDCVMDMAAFALNVVKPSYRVSLMGKLYASSMEDGDYALSVKEAVAKAIDKVHANPMHD
jgi:competence protein ComFB